MRGRALSWRCGFLVLLSVVAGSSCRTEPDTPEARLKSRPTDETPPSQSASAPAQASPAAQPPSAPPSGSAPAPRGYAGPLPPLPNVPYPPARPLEVTRAVYAFAAQSPEVLRYVPCFCGCEHHGHQGNDDCFVSSRDADGKPRWEMHGYV